MAERSSGSEEDPQEGDGCEAFVCRHVAGYPTLYMFVYSNRNLGNLSPGMLHTVIPFGQEWVQGRVVIAVQFIATTLIYFLIGHLLHSNHSVAEHFQYTFVMP